ncbi:MAG TPA: hypothetical protein VE977_00965, partial [Pyrinomonadaceae bacterium]|nr:hypothetical protein [Pyrinomonadaceae bacterium]
LASKLAANAAPEVLQAVWSTLLDELADGAHWRFGNSALETSSTFDLSQSEFLLRKSGLAVEDLRRMQSDADVLIERLIAASSGEKATICEQLGERLFSNGFRVCADIRLTNVPVVEQARTADLSKNLDGLSLENWQCHSALVHPAFKIYRQCALLREALGAPAAEQLLTVIQFNTPNTTPGFWIGAEMRGASPAADISQNFGGTVSLALELPKNWNPATKLSGLIFDEWTEALPARETTSGVAFHFNQPDTEPAQVMLLAVCPAEGENWSWEFLLETILDTFERAKKRLINFDHLKTNPALAHMLPALVTPLERDNLAANLDLGRNEVDVAVDEKGRAPLVSL